MSRRGTTARRGSAAGGAARGAAVPRAAFPLFAEVMLIGVMTAVASLGVVTALGALTAGCASVHEYLEHDARTTPRRYLALLRAASRGAVPLLAPPVLIAVAAADLLAWRAGLPGGPVVGPAALAVSLAAMVVGLRAAAGWRPLPDPTAADEDRPDRSAPRGPVWSGLLAAAAAEAAADWPGSLLIAGAIAACVALAVEMPVLVVVLPGLLVLAAVAVRGRRPVG
jgi:hypothetical protein